MMHESSASHFKNLPAPDIIVVGVATHMIKTYNDSDEGLVEYRRGMKELLPDIQRAVRMEGSRVLFMVQPTVDRQKLHDVR